MFLLCGGVAGLLIGAGAYEVSMLSHGGSPFWGALGIGSGVMYLCLLGKLALHDRF